jgi:hypothetical protein
MQNKKSKKLQNKNALEFVLLNRGIDDPNYDNHNAPSKILMHVPKEDDQVNKEHQKIIQAIPEISRGVYSEEAIDTQLKQMGIELRGDKSGEAIDAIKEKLNELNKEHLYKAIDMELKQKELNKHLKSSKLTVDPAEEIVIDTNLPLIDDNKVDQIFEKAKIKAEVVEYNEYGLKKNIDPELLKYVTNKEFREGVDIFIPAPNLALIDQYRFDIDIKPEEMDEEYKEVYDALKSDDEDDNQKVEEEEVEGIKIEKVIKGDELEDNFVVLANEGELPIELAADKKSYGDKDQIVLAETKSKIAEPSFKFITKEEKEMLDRRFEKTFKEYNNPDEDNSHKKNKVVKVDKLMEDAVNEMLGDKSKKKVDGLTARFEDEDEYEDYEIDDDGEGNELDNENEEYEDYEDEEEVEDKPHVKSSNNKDELTETAKEEHPDDDDIEDDEEELDFNNQGNIKIEYVNSNKGKNKKRKPKKNFDNEEFTLKDLNEIITDKESIGISIGLIAKTIKENPEALNDIAEAEDEEIPEYFPKKRLDITSVHAKIGVFPKTIKGEGEKKEKTNKIDPMLEKDKAIHNHQTTLTVNKKNTDDIILENETKENKKLRKKLLKEEKKEKRKQKKELKNAFKVIS